MNKKIIHRIDQIRKHYGLSYNAFDNLFGFSNGYIGGQIRNEKTVGSDVIEKISCYFTDINLKWFLTGEGEMIEINTLKEPKSSYLKNPSIEKLIDDKIDAKLNVALENQNKALKIMDKKIKNIQNSINKN